ncbi:exodeoxyribonuclease V subunit gamma [Myxococcota bacterium]|nr:exodeoxyribonuclease V subunit gamma [Myxococcota bacterium]
MPLLASPTLALDALLDDLRHLPDPFTEEWIIVEGDGTARWLQFQIAQQLGICAGLRFLTPEDLRAVSACPPVWATLAQGQGEIDADELEHALYATRRAAGWRLGAEGGAVQLRPGPYPPRAWAFGLNPRAPWLDALLDDLGRVTALRVLDLSPPSPPAEVRQISAARPEEVALEVIRASMAELRLEPRDVLIAVEDVERVAAAFSATFAGVLPLQIADRPTYAAHPVGAALAHTLRVLRGRLRASEVLALLAEPPIQARFSLKSADFERLEVWLDEAQVRWGADGAHREALRLPRFEEQTWRFGLDRLILGVAMTSGPRMFGGVLPEGEVEGETALLGRFVDFVEQLLQARHALTPAPMVTWAARLGAWLDALMAFDADNARDQAFVRAQLALAIDATPRPLTAAAIAAWLDDLLCQPDPASGFFQGEVTLAALSAPRPVPFPLVVVVGDAPAPLWATRRLIRLHVDPSAAPARPLGSPPPPFFPGPLPEIDPPTELGLDELARFLAGPIKHLLRSRLGVLLPEYAPIPDQVPGHLDGLARWRVGEALLEWCLAGTPLIQAREAMRASGLLPPGKEGQRRFDEVADEAGQIAAFALRLRGEPEPPKTFRRKISGVYLTGRLTHLGQGGRAQPSFSRPQGRRILDLWVTHLALHVLGYQTNSHLIGRARGGPAHVWLSPLSEREALTHLEGLVQLYLEGQSWPLLFFPDTSSAYHQALRGRADVASRRDAEARAQKMFVYEGGPLAPYLDGWTPQGGSRGFPRPAGYDFHDLAMLIWGRIEGFIGR